MGSAMPTSSTFKDWRPHFSPNQIKDLLPPTIKMQCIDRTWVSPIMAGTHTLLGTLDLGLCPTTLNTPIFPLLTVDHPLIKPTLVLWVLSIRGTLKFLITHLCQPSPHLTQINIYPQRRFIINDKTLRTNSFLNVVFLSNAA